MQITLKANERLFLNGAVLRANKKVTIELMNDATFLLESHIIQKEETDTPLKQLYYAAQLILMDPSNEEKTLPIFLQMLTSMISVVNDAIILKNLKECVYLYQDKRLFEILKILRSLFKRESEIMHGSYEHREFV